jgi:hypothetical protein
MVIVTRLSRLEGRIGQGLKFAHGGDDDPRWDV